MDLIFFDLDGTLLNSQSQISDFTRETLALLRKNDIAYTVATGRTMLSASAIIAEHSFLLPHIYNNGVTVFNPQDNSLRLENLVNPKELEFIISLAQEQEITPFVNVIAGTSHEVYHPPARHPIEHDLLSKYFKRTDAVLLPLSQLSLTDNITNISMIGDSATIHSLWDRVNKVDTLVAYSGPAIEGNNFSWMDIHHRAASKGGAVKQLKQQLGATNIICFGDGDNDLSMFELADESYAPDNAKQAIKQAASEVIGHHNEDGIARFLRQRFSL